MRAVCWNGKKDVRVETVPDPFYGQAAGGLFGYSHPARHAGGQAEYVRVPFADSRICVHLKR
jgi:hypothetical protein